MAVELSKLPAHVAAVFCLATHVCVGGGSCHMTATHSADTVSTTAPAPRWCLRSFLIILHAALIYIDHSSASSSIAQRSTYRAGGGVGGRVGGRVGECVGVGE